MSRELFDISLRALRRDRAFKQRPELFLYERAFEDCLERISLNRRHFQSCLLVGCPDPGWPARLNASAEFVTVADPGLCFAEAAGGTFIMEEHWPAPPGKFDLCVAIGTLDSVNDLPRALRSLRLAMQPNGLLIGAISGGDTLPQLRSAMHAADQMVGVSSPHVHPRVEPSAVAPLLVASGFIMPVVDVDRAQVSYRSFGQLVTDLRRMGATNILKSRSRLPLSRQAAAAAVAAFGAAGVDGQTIETFEILHFAAWTPSDLEHTATGLRPR